MRDHIREFQGATAPWSMVRESSGTRVLRSTVRTTPVPPQVRQAPWLLKDSPSAEGAWNGTPHSRQTIGLSAATSNVGGLGWPLGHTCSARREYIRRSEFSSSVPVPKVLRIPGTPGRWCMASEAGTYSTSSTCALGAWVMRLRV